MHSYAVILRATVQHMQKWISDGSQKMEVIWSNKKLWCVWLMN